MARKDTLLEDLTIVGQRRADARREAAEAMTRIEKLARSAHKAGATKVAIAAAAQISRPALDEILKS